MSINTWRRRFTYLSVLAMALGLVLPVLLAPVPARADTWVQEADDGFIGGFNRMQLDATATATFDDGSGAGPRLYVGTFNLQGTGCQVWRQDGPLPGNWTLVNLDGFGDHNNIDVSGMAVYAHGGTTYLYVATQNGATGCEIWRTAGTGGAGGGPYTDWTPIAPAGFGTNANGSAILATDGNFLYAGTFNGMAGCEVWSSKGTPLTPYTDWALTAPAGFGAGAANYAVTSLHVFGSGNGFLHAGTGNAGGCEVWSLTPAGWTRVDAPGGAGGFGNPANDMACSMNDLGGVLYVGTRNMTNGCGLWGSAGLTGAPPPPYLPYIDWAPLIAAPGFGNINNTELSSLAPFGGQMFAGTFNAAPGLDVWTVAPGAFPGGLPWVWMPSQIGGFGPDDIRASVLTVSGGSLHLGVMNHRSGCEVWSLPGLAGPWSQANVNGFAFNNTTAASAMLEFQGDLFAGTTSMTTGCRLYRYDGPGWTQVNQDGFGRDNNSYIKSMAVYEHGGTEYLYVGTFNQAGGCEVWRTAGTGGPPYSDWVQVNAGGFGTAGNQDASCMAVCGHGGQDYLYVGAQNNAGGCEVWRTAGTGGPPYSDWVQVNAGGFGDANNIIPFSMAAVGGRLFVGTVNGSSGCEVWFTSGAGGPPYGDWAQANADGFGDANNQTASSMAVLGGDLYVGTNNFTTGGEVWRSACSGAAPFADWAQVNADGFGDANNQDVYSLCGFYGGLYAGTVNGISGAGVWKSFRQGGPPFTDWAQVNAGGFSDVDNVRLASLAACSERLFAGTMNLRSGCEVWSTAAPAWYLAEGCTDGGMETWVLVQNPNAYPVDVSLEFMTSTGQVAGPQVSIPAKSRSSFNVNSYVTSFDVSTKVVPSGGPVVCERAMYGSGRTWAHDSIGVLAPPATQWYLAEGSTDGGMETWVLVQNPGDAAAAVNILFQTGAGEVAPPALQGVNIPPRSRRTFRVNDYVTTYDVSTRVDCTAGGVVCERAMYGSERAWAHDSVGVAAPSTAWYLAEGSTDGGMETFVLVQNPGGADALATIAFQTDSGEVSPASLKNVTIPARSRSTFKVNDYVTTYDVSTLVTADRQVICERAMYGSGRTWAHDSIGAASPDDGWYLAEGCTEGGMETFVLVQNPGSTDAVVNIAFQTDAGEVAPPLLQGVTIPGRSRRTFKVNDYVVTYNVSTRVTATAGTVICERAMYGSERAWAHDSIGYSP